MHRVHSAADIHSSNPQLCADDRSDGAAAAQVTAIHELLERNAGVGTEAAAAPTKASSSESGGQPASSSQGAMLDKRERNQNKRARKRQAREMSTDACEGDGSGDGQTATKDEPDQA